MHAPSDGLLTVSALPFLGVVMVVAIVMIMVISGKQMGFILDDF